ncbi:3-deoxy-manno-octulosonate cytidylyltransferase [Microvirga sp. W0021]|uniref:3-deoxy-manno-octulosonate cytidylyltransferase n=1 Tax=Hohaiivirga grylli TaxID=3133970 RepID=A0ABV0BHH4_9HYPH
MKPLVLIPSRLAATRLPNKPLADIAGDPMIVHVWRRACEADIGPVAIATDAEEIAEVVTKAGAQVVMTSANHTTGSDRIHEALQKLDPAREYDVVVNVQGDLPTIDPKAIAASIQPLDDTAVSIATLVAEIKVDEERSNPNVVKMVGTKLFAPNRYRALYFTRATAPYGDGPLYHHIGLYAYRRMALERFVTMSPSQLEIREKLEQLRAIEAGMRIDAMVVDDVPLGVDTPADLERARQIIAERQTAK